MKRFTAAALFAVWCGSIGYGQQAIVTSGPVHVKVYSGESGLKPPKLLPLNMPIPAATKCKKKIDGKVEVSLLVDTDGRARNIMFVRPLGTDADKVALQIADADRFTLASYDGNPVVAASHMWLKIQSCLVETNDKNGAAAYTVRLRSNPDQELLPATDAPQIAVLSSGKFTWDDKEREPKIKNSESKAPRHLNTTHAPVPILQPLAECTKEAQKARINGICQISLIVDPQGMPRNLHVYKSLDPGLDQNAMIAVDKYRFKPAMRDGEPVPVFVIMEVNYKIW